MGLKDFATGIVATAPSPATSGTTLVLGSGEGARMPETPFEATAHSPYDFPTLDTAEKIIVTDVTGDTLTFSRADGDTTAKSIDVGWRITAAVFKRNLQQTNAIPVTVSTAAATAAKVGTTTEGSYEPKAGDLIEVTFVNGCSVSTPTLNIDSSGAVNIRLGNANVSTSLFNLGSTSSSNVKVLMFFDGTYWQIFGSTTNTTYSEITTAEIDAGTASTARAISGRRAQYIMDQAVSDVKAATNASEFGISIDEDDMSSDSATKLPTQQSVKAYVDDKTLGSNSFISDETPTGSVNGSNTSFTTSSAYVSGTLEVFVNGVKQARTTHYTETTPGSGVFTMSDAPVTGDVVRVNYQHTSGAAGNADTVDGFHASATPTANTLLPLNSNAEYPLDNLEDRTNSSYVSDDEGTSSTTYTDLDTVQSVTVDVGASGKVLVFWSLGSYNSAGIRRSSVAVSGASTQAASDGHATRNDSGASFGQKEFMAHLFTGLNPGSTTFTLKFKCLSGTGNFFDRMLTVQPL